MLGMMNDDNELMAMKACELERHFTNDLLGVPGCD